MRQSSPQLALRRIDWLLIALVAGISLSLFLPTAALLHAFCLGFFLYALWEKKWELFPALLVLTLLFFSYSYLPEFLLQMPTAHFLIPVLLTLVICAAFKPLKPQLAWCGKGEVDPISWLIAAAISLIASAALLLWAATTNNLGAGAGMVKELVGIPLWFLLFVGVPAFALINAFVEEAVYRGFLQQALMVRLPGRDYLVLALQASAFAAAHYFSGFPNGLVGYGMTFLYALSLGYLRLRTGGVLVPFLAHVTADLVIGYTLVLLAA